MTSVQPLDELRLHSPMSNHGPTSIRRFHSSRIAPQNTDDNSPRSPTELHIDQMSVLSDVRLKSPFAENKAHEPSPEEPSSMNGHNNEQYVTISQYRTPENTPFQPLSSKVSPKKLNNYILITPRKILSISLLSFLSIAVILIGLGIAASYRISQLNYRCPLISYCPRDSSYMLLCNITNEFCTCYDSEDLIFGCMKQRHYEEGCYRSQECSSKYNLQCNTSLYQCKCLDHYFYNGSLCIPLITYGQSCSLLNDTCDYLLNLSCSSGSEICECNIDKTFWNGQYCESYRTNNELCDPYKNISGCATTFICDNTTNRCRCPLSSYYDEGVCLAYSSYLEPCYEASSCLPYSLLVCSWGLCLCQDDYYYWSPSTLKCTYPKVAIYNASCDYQTGCEGDFGLRCINSRCLCEVNSYWTPGNYCDFQSQYDEQCSTAPCLAYTGLQCSPNTSTCTCPAYYYWDNFVCQYQRTYTGFCIYDQWCRMDLGLRCRNFSCTCSLCPRCFWDGVRCRDCPTSWQLVISNGTMQPRIYCYVKVDSYLHWNESVTACSTAATSFFGTKSHLVYIDDLQELQDISVFATTQYYDVFIGHTNSFNYGQWYLTNGTSSPAFKWCNGTATTYSTLTCTRLLSGLACVADIACYGWTSRYICELD